ncbi:cytochrome c biogenesis protein ResB [Texcoconibacillus texcoconensis]|uniref:Cytochrome c biogenesis protein n=1 Tax=Texcoconibacillus texcoconensis TaxID=1095777 RepID=A0A840QNL9_9BACI|nr:cytochrome c biogenesis protein ResB [Texcoconibacillus texcoconensis]MBB5172950.1 cytochrome c biogenesis protein [Texcoconibacillus texcoconensis]
MEKVKCECGHVNPYGTVICESCGKPLQDEGKSLLNMRYEGAARRSQTYKRSVVDHIWNFFSSVKVGIWIIVLLLVASGFGTIFPQVEFIPPGENPAVFYENEYGTIGQLYYLLGFHNLYGSWWYMLLIAALGVSLVICSLDRVVPLYRALKKQRVTRHEGFLKRQRVFGTSRGLDHEGEIEKATKVLNEKKYNIYEENGNIVAEKGRFSRWGPYVNHIGLIIFLFGAMLRFFPTMYVDENIWVRDGEQVPVKGTDGQYYLYNENFEIELYDEDDELYQEALMREGSSVVETYRTSAVLLERSDDGIVGSEADYEKVKSHDIEVNDPLTHDGYSIYQVDYKLNELSEFSFRLQSVADDNGDVPDTEITVDLYDPEMSYDLGGGYVVEIEEYFPDYVFDEHNQEPTTATRIPDNPLIIFNVQTPSIPDGEKSVVGVQTNEPILGENEYRLELSGVEMNDVTALTVRLDRTLPLLIVGGFIFMVGLIQGSYWSHRRIWLQQKGEELWVAGHTNKNWQSLMKDFEAISSNTNIAMPIDQVEEDELEQERQYQRRRDEDQGSDVDA